MGVSMGMMMLKNSLVLLQPSMRAASSISLRDGVEEAAHQEDGKADVQPQADIDDRDQTVVHAQLGGIDLHQRDHVGLEGCAHGGQHQVIDGGNELMPHTADRVGGHGAQQRR